MPKFTIDTLQTAPIPAAAVSDQYPYNLVGHLGDGSSYYSSAVNAKYGTANVIGYYPAFHRGVIPAGRPKR